MNAEDRFMDALLDRLLGDVQAPQLVLPASPPPARSPSLFARRRLVWGAAAILLLGLGIVIVTGQQPDVERPAGVRAPETAAIKQDGKLLRVESGYALIDESAAPVAFEDGTVKPVGGKVVVVAGALPEGAAMDDMLAWLTGPGGVNPGIAAALSSPAQWFQGKAGALALLSGGLLISGTDDISWAGRTWSRDRVGAPPRVALVASRDAVGRLGRLGVPLKIADVDAGDAFVAAIAAVRTLTHVDVSGCRGVSDASVRRLAALERLTTLSLADTSVGNGGLAWLARTEQLADLDLRGLDRITAEGLGVLADTHEHRLKRLDLRRGAVIDAATLEALARCTALETLALTVTKPVPADAWAALATLTSLRRLRLEGSPEALGGDAVDQLRTSLPECEIRVARMGSEGGAGDAGR